MPQLVFSFPNLTLYHPKNFSLNSCNEMAYAWIEQQSLLSSPSCFQGAILQGPKFSGKTFLCHMVRHMNPSSCLLNGQDFSSLHPFDISDSFVIIDDADKAPNAWLFHLFNHCLENRIRLFLTTSSPYRVWSHLQDLTSRLSTLTSLQIQSPDDQTLYDFLQKRLEEKGLKISPALLKNITFRMERGYESAHHIVQQIYEETVQSQKKISYDFLRKI